MGKFGCFQHVLCHNSAIFEDIDLKLYTNIHQSLPSNMLHAFLKILFFKGKMFRKYKILRIFVYFFSEFSKFEKFEIAVL